MKHFDIWYNFVLQYYDIPTLMILDNNPRHRPYIISGLAGYNIPEMIHNMDQEAALLDGHGEAWAYHVYWQIK